MENKKPLVLISNDDGYHANGIKTLVKLSERLVRPAGCCTGKCPFGIRLCLLGYYSLALEASPQYGE